MAISKKGVTISLRTDLREKAIQLAARFPFNGNLTAYIEWLIEHDQPRIAVFMTEKEKAQFEQFRRSTQKVS